MKGRKMGSRFDVFVGDLVQLKSGGQIMTVHQIASGKVSCIWHDREGRFQEATIDKQVLQKVDSARSDAPNILVSGISNQVSWPPAPVLHDPPSLSAAPMPIDG